MVRLKSLKKLLSKYLKFEREKSSISLYIHFPFCKSKCFYCDFNSFPLADHKEKTIESYVRRVIEEFDFFYSDLSELHVKTMYIGGGTPSFVGCTAVERVLREISSYLDLSNIEEATFEANPESLNFETAKGFKEIGFDRVSIGVQSFSNEELKILGRNHLSSDAKKAIDAARRAGFENINIDLIYGIPKQTVKSFEKTLKEAIFFEPQGISCYCLTVSSKTLLSTLIKNGRLKLPNEEELEEMYHLACEVLKSSGYIHYEVSNWAKPGFECQHNLRYWQRKPYISLGAGASSFIPPLRYKNEDTPYKYLSKSNLYELEYSIDPVEGESEALERLYLSLRMKEGISINDLIHLGKTYFPAIYEIAKNFEDMNLLEFTEKGMRVTEKGWLKLDRIVVELTSGVLTEI